MAAALAVAAEHLGRADLLDAAVRGAEHLVALADLADDGFLLPTMDPHTNPDVELVTFTWCHGPAGTSYLWPALQRAGVERVAGVVVEEWWERCLRSIMTSGIPERLRPGFWDNDGRCCGTAGVGDVFLDAAQRVGGAERAYLDFAGRLGDALLERVVRDDEGARWRFVEHRNEEPLLAPHRAGCRGRWASRPSCSGWPGCWTTAWTLRSSTGRTAGGRCRSGCAPPASGSRMAAPVICSAPRLDPEP